MDLPGYGYAKVSHALRELWGKEIQRWLLEDAELSLLILLIDGYVGIQKTDSQMVAFLQAEEIPFVVAFTKMDKWKSKNQFNKAKKELESAALDLGIIHNEFLSVYQPDTLAKLMHTINSHLNS